MELTLAAQVIPTRPDQLNETGLTIEETREVLDGLAGVVEPVRLRFLWRPQLKDPGDEMVLETAFNGQADCLVTCNARHFEAAANEFGLRVAAPREILQELRGGRK